MKQGTLTGLLAVIAVILFAACAAVFILSDRTEPTILFSGEELTYTEGEDEEALLAGVQGTDETDGSVPVYVEGIYPLGDGLAKIYYAAVDEAGNVAKASRVVHYIETGNEAEAGGSLAVSGLAEPPEEETEAAETETPEDENETTEAETEPPNPEAPVITLTTDRVELAVGATFQYALYIDSIEDDVDEEDTLYRRINVDGDYDTNQPGTYEIMYTVYDSDGNRSAPVYLTLVVQ